MMTSFRRKSIGEVHKEQYITLVDFYKKIFYSNVIILLNF